MPHQSNQKGKSKKYKKKRLKDTMTVILDL
jgi:hypothetical protein